MTSVSTVTFFQYIHHLFCFVLRGKLKKMCFVEMSEIIGKIIISSVYGQKPSDKGTIK